MTVNFVWEHFERGYNSLIEMNNPDHAEKIKMIVDTRKGMAQYELGEFDSN